LLWWVFFLSLHWIRLMDKKVGFFHNWIFFWTLDCHRQNQYHFTSGLTNFIILSEIIKYVQLHISMMTDTVHNNFKIYLR
jgi:hypothetical protein